MRSRRLDVACRNLLSHKSDVPEFLIDIAPPDTPSSFPVASDMSTAIRLLHDLASDAGASVPLFRALVAFLLSLSVDSLPQLSKFHVQIKQIHMSLIPASTVSGLLKLDIMEDFLLSLSTRHVNLALDLVWSLQGELETPRTLKDYHVIRFIREIEIAVCGGELVVAVSRRPRRFIVNRTPSRRCAEPSPGDLILCADRRCLRRKHRLS